jgi:hypothetical protein
MLRVCLAVGALIAAALIASAGAGVTVADPGDAGAGTGSEPGPESGASTPGDSDPPTGSAKPTTHPPAVRPPSIFDLPQTIATQLRDLMGRPRSVFGDGRTPGQAVPGAPRGHGRDRPGATTKPAAPSASPTVLAPQRRSGSAVDVVLPFAPPISVPIPPPVLGYHDLRLTLDLRDPAKAYASLQDTVKTVNSLLTDAYAPYDPFAPPRPTPAMRTFTEEPVVDAAGSGGDGSALSAGSSNLPVLQLPVLVPGVPPMALPPAAPRMAPRAASESPPPGPVPVAGSVAPGPEPAAPAPQRVRQPPPSPAAATTNSEVREGYPRYLRTARPGEVLAVALPGLAGLIVLTAGGGVVGYRQANSGRYLRSGAARFLQ